MSARRSSRAAPEPLHVLVVDDSAVVRQILARVLSAEPGMLVSVAADPLIAMAKMQQCRPDVIVLDLEMPRMDGLTFLRRLMAEEPLPVVVCSGLAGPWKEAAVRALEEGALEIIAKPSLGVGGFLEESHQRLVEVLRAAARARVVRRPPRAERPARLEPVPLRFTTDKVVAIGASTGGTEALHRLLAELPPDFPGLVIVQHMPEPFTASFAARLDAASHIEVKEARDGDRVRSGRALLAPGGRHLKVSRDGAQYVARVTEGEPMARHLPSVDVLFRSVARAAGPNAIGVLLTGMGRDGAEGLLAMREAGAVTVAQDEATSVVFGMPKEAIALGAATLVVPLPEIPARIAAALDRAPR